MTASLGCMCVCGVRVKVDVGNGLGDAGLYPGGADTAWWLSHAALVGHWRHPVYCYHCRCYDNRWWCHPGSGLRRSPGGL